MNHLISPNLVDSKPKSTAASRGSSRSSSRTNDAGNSYRDELTSLMDQKSKSSSSYSYSSKNNPRNQGASVSSSAPQAMLGSGNVEKGDLNEDGVVELLDRKLMSDYFFGRKVTYNLKNADFDDDGNVDVSDLSEMDQKLAKVGAFKSVLKGDANSDGKVDEADLEHMKKYMRGKASSINMSAVDADWNGKITATDLSKLVKLVNEIRNQQQSTGISGDINNDGTVDKNDSELLKKYLVDLVSKNDIYNADLNGDDTVDIGDLSKLTDIIEQLNPRQEATGILGDINNDGKLDKSDAVAVMSHIVEIEKITDNETLQRMDINDDGKVDLDDAKILIDQVGATELKKYVNKLEEAGITISSENNNSNYVLGAGTSNYYIKGDVNGDGELDVLDITALEMHLVGLKKITDANALTRADYNADGQISLLDLERATATLVDLIPKEYVGQYLRKMSVDTQVVSGSGYLVGIIRKGTNFRVLNETNDWYRGTWVESINADGSENWKTAWIPKNNPISNLQPTEMETRNDLIGFSDPSFQNVSLIILKGFRGNVVGESDNAIQLSNGQYTAWIPKQIYTAKKNTRVYDDNGNHKATFNVDSPFTVLYEDDNWYKGIWIERYSDGTVNTETGWILKSPDPYSQATRQKLCISSDEELYNFPSNDSSVGYTMTGNMYIQNIHTSEVHDGKMKVSMDIYNQAGIPGVLEVLDDTGAVIKRFWIEDNKFAASSYTELTDYVINKVKDNFIDGFQRITGKMNVTYDNASASKITKIRDLEIPVGTHIRFTNNIDQSEDLKAYFIASSCYDALMLAFKALNIAVDGLDPNCTKVALQDVVKKVIPDLYLRSASDLVEDFAKQIKNDPARIWGLVGESLGKHAVTNALKSTFNTAVGIGAAMIAPEIALGIKLSFNVMNAINQAKSIADAEKYRSSKPLHYYFYGR